MRSSQITRHLDWSCAWAFVLPLALILYLGFNGGGFDTLVSGRVGIAIWWILLLAVAVGALPARRPGPLALTALALFAALALWTALSLRWTESTEQTAIDVARIATYLGVFALALASRRAGTARWTVAAVAVGISVLIGAALLSRLQPGLIPAASETARFLSTGRERLSYPVNYWNALAVLVAIAAPLLAELASTSRRLWAQAAAAAMLPVLAVTISLTLSRGGIATAIAVLVLYVAFAADRLPRLATLLVGGIGSAVAVVLTHQRDAVVHGYAGPAGHREGDEVLLIVMTIAVLVALAQVGIALALRRGRPRWTEIPRRPATLATAATLGILLLAFLAVGGPGRAADAWSDFKQPSTSPGQGAQRLSSVAGESRYQFWSSAIREFQSEPLTGTGANTFQFWWTRDTDVPETVPDTHSLYLQSLGELGIVGFLLLIGFAATALIGGTIVALRLGAARRSLLAAALAGASALFLASIVDWFWKIPVLPVSALFLLSVAITATDCGPSGAPEQAGRHAPLRWPTRVAAGAFALFAIVAITIPLAGTALVRESQDAARRGDLGGALEDARSAANVQPGAATPRLQEALVLERAGEFDRAVAAITEATKREPTHWQLWLIRSRIEAQAGRVDASLASYERARSLNPLAEIFTKAEEEN